MEESVTCDQWHELTEEQKEILRTWAIEQKLGLEIVPSETAEVCDYAALLTVTQLKDFLKNSNEKVESDDLRVLWNGVKHSLSK